MKTSLVISLVLNALLIAVLIALLNRFGNVAKATVSNDAAVLVWQEQVLAILETEDHSRIEKLKGSLKRNVDRK